MSFSVINDIGVDAQYVVKVSFMDTTAAFLSNAAGCHVQGDYLSVVVMVVKGRAVVLV